jgi:hypothetical protein
MFTYDGLGASLEMRAPGERCPFLSPAMLDLRRGRF